MKSKLRVEKKLSIHEEDLLEDNYKKIVKAFLTVGGGSMFTQRGLSYIVTNKIMTSIIITM